METVLQDLRFAARRLRRAPGFALAAIATLALGIGATTAIFSVVNGVLLRSLPYSESDRLVALRSNTSAMNLKDILAWSHATTSGGGYVSQPLDLTGGDEPEQIPTALVTGGLFQSLGTRAERGRTLDASDDRAGAARVVVVSHSFWKRRMGGESGAIGRLLTLSGNPYAVVGVLPAAFSLPQSDAEVFAPLEVVFPEAAQHRGVNFLRTCLRLAPGATLAGAGGEMEAIGRRLAEAAPDENKNRDWTVVSLLDRVVGGVRRALWILLGAVALALLVACSNFANLLLARSASRVHELAVRTSLGAGRMDVVRQLLSESLLLSLAGGALGVVLAVWGVDLLVALDPPSLPRLTSIAIDRNVLTFAAALSVVTGLVFGLLPALPQSGQAVASGLKQGASTSVSSGGAFRLQHSLVVSQVALALMLLIGAGLLLNGFVRLLAVEPGFDPTSMLSFRLELPEARYHDRDAQHRYQDRVLEALGRLPGAQAALVSELPLGGDALSHNFVIEGAPPIAEGEEPELWSRSVAGDYFGVMRIPLRAGHAFTPQDREGAARVGVINESMARRYFPGASPLGKRIRWAREQNADSWITIVGVVADIRQFGLDMDEQPAIYTPYAQFNEDWKRWMHVVVRSRENEGKLSREAKQLVWSVDPLIPLTRVEPLTHVMASSMSDRRFELLMIGLFAVVALALAAVGIYGVTAYGVGRRTREIGLRMALGASQRDVWWLVVLGGLKWITIGVAAGTAGALALSRLIASQLYEVRPMDPPTYAAVAVVLGLVALAACAIPAARAARLDPMAALRTD
jgi:putative ABC transport system permease protein